MRTLLLIVLISSGTYAYASQDSTINFFSCDINGDGIRDLIYTETIFNIKHETAFFSRFTAKAFYGTSKGLSTNAAWSFFSSDSIQGMEALNFDFDVNNDGLKDLLAVGNVMFRGKEDTRAAIMVVYNSKEGFKNPPVILQTVDIPVRQDRQYFFCDYNSDGLPDLVVESWGEALTMGDPNSKVGLKNQVMYGSLHGFSEPKQIDLNTHDEFAQLIDGLDYDGDRLKDLVLEDYHKGYAQYALLSTKNKTREKWVSFEESFETQEKSDLFYQPGDVNGDGFNDACFVKIESKRHIKNHAPGYTLTILRGPVDTSKTDTLINYPLYNWSSLDYVVETFVYALGDFDGNGSADLLIKNQEPFDYVKDPSGFKQDFIVWGGDPPQIDSMGNQAFTDFLHNSQCVLLGVGDLNGDKKDDLLLYRNEKQYIVYGNKERKFDPVEWVHE
jgi:hypothetical protein